MGTGSRLTQHTRLRTLQVVAFLAFITTWILLVVATKQQLFRPRNRDHTPWHSSLGFDLSTCFANGDQRCWAEAKRRAWLDSLNIMEKNFTEEDLYQYRDPVKFHRTSDLWPVTYDCDLNDFSRVGRGNDGGKWICGPLHLETEKCIIFSLGSNGDFSFERSMKEYTNSKCEIHTFDCTGGGKNWEDKSTNFHPWCIAGKDEVIDGRAYKRLATILKELKLPHISYLKMDIEGYEWQALPDIFDSEVGALPKQISFEIHATLEYAPFVKDLGPNSNWAYPMIRMGRQFDRAGYRVAAREDNHIGACGGCSEFVLVREE